MNEHIELMVVRHRLRMIANDMPMMTMTIYDNDNDDDNYEVDDDDTEVEDDMYLNRSTIRLKYMCNCVFLCVRPSIYPTIDSSILVISSDYSHRYLCLRSFGFKTIPSRSATYAVQAFSTGIGA